MMNEYALNLDDYLITSPPGDSLLEALEARRMTQAELALRMGRPLKTINEIVKGKAAITPETALQLELVFDTPASFWLNREIQYRESQARWEEKQKHEQYLNWMDKFPIKEMISLGWLIPTSSPKIGLFRQLLQFFGVSSPTQLQEYWLKTIPDISDSSSFQCAPESTTAWLRRGEIQSQAAHTAPYQARILREQLPYLKDLVHEPKEILFNELVQFCGRAGVAVCLTPPLPGLSVTMVTRWLSPQKALLQLNARPESREDFWKNIYYGLGNILLSGKKAYIFEEKTINTLSSVQQIIAFVNSHLSEVLWAKDAPRLVWSSNLIEPRVDTLADWDIFIDEEKIADLQIAQAKMNTLQHITGWPGISVAARRALAAAGLEDEAGQLDERLFGSWLQDQVGKIHSALGQGYTRDALADLKDLAYLLKLHAALSPVIEGMLSLVNLVIDQVNQPADQLTQKSLISQLSAVIQQANQPVQTRMVSDSKQKYAATSTQTERSLAENWLSGAVRTAPHEEK